MVSTDLEVKSDTSPFKFWSAIILAFLSVVGASGGTSYLASRQGTTYATIEAARVAATEAAKEQGQELKGELLLLRSRTNALEISQASNASDMAWIKRSLQRIETKMDGR